MGKRGPARGVSSWINWGKGGVFHPGMELRKTRLLTQKQGQTK